MLWKGSGEPETWFCRGFDPCPLWVKSRHHAFKFEVRYTPESGHPVSRLECPLRANSRRAHRHSITLSARASIAGGMVRPMASAVLRLMMKLNFVGN